MILNRNTSLNWLHCDTLWFANTLHSTTFQWYEWCMECIPMISLSMAVHDAWIASIWEVWHTSHFWPRETTQTTLLVRMDQDVCSNVCLWQPSMVQIHWWKWLSHRTWIMGKRFVVKKKRHTHTHTFCFRWPIPGLYRNPTVPFVFVMKWWSTLGEFKRRSISPGLLSRE